jgi:hypothetical protein
MHHGPVGKGKESENESSSSSSLDENSRTVHEQQQQQQPLDSREIISQKCAHEKLRHKFTSTLYK